MRVKNWIVAGVTACLFSTTAAQAGPEYLFWISYTDKQAQLIEAGADRLLSPRALARRNRQGIPLDTTDLPVPASYLHRTLALLPGHLHLTSRWLNGCVIRTEDTSGIPVLRQQSFVQSLRLVGYSGSRDQSRRTGKFSRNSGTSSIAKARITGDPAHYGSTWQQTELVNGDCLHDQGWQGEDMLIAVLDDGFHYVNTAPAFDSVFDGGRIVDTRNIVEGHADVYTDFMLHGTQVLSTMAGNIPNTYVGAAPGASYALYVTEDPGSETPVEMLNMVAAFERADSIGADVISTSLGYNTFDPPFQDIPQVDMDGKTTPAAIAANLAAGKGILMVITMGNEGSGGLLTPGDADSALTIGNVNNNKIPAGNSGYGPNADGVIKPEVCAQGAPGFVITSGAAFQASGTSIATPQIAGFAACLWQGSPGRTNSEIRQAIIQSSHLYPLPQMPQLGYGVPDFCLASLKLSAGTPGVDAFGVTAYPNPFDREIILQIRSGQSATVTVRLISLEGKLVYSGEFPILPGANSQTIRLPHTLAPGVYLCHLSTGMYTGTLSLIKR